MKNNGQGQKDLKTLTQWWDQNSREKIEAIWQHVWLPAIDGIKSMMGPFIGRLELWREIQIQQNEETLEETGSVNKESARKQYYDELNGKDKKLGLSKKQMKLRIDEAVDLMGACIKRIKEVYELDAVDYFRLISINQKEISMLWDFLLDMFGDLVEKKSGGGYKSRRKAKDQAAESIPAGEGGINSN